MSRRVKVSDYAHAKGVWVNTSSDYAGNCAWWLRSPGDYANRAARIDDYGSVCGKDGLVDYVSDACVPAMHINLSSDLWSMVDNGFAVGNKTENAGVSAVTPQKSSLKGKITAKSKSFTVKWKKQTDVSGYQIQYSTNKKFKKGTKTKTVKKANASKLTVKKLKAGKKYYVRVRTCKTINGTDYYSPWSKSKSVKTKD